MRALPGSDGSEARSPDWDGGAWGLADGGRGVAAGTDPGGPCEQPPASQCGRSPREPARRLSVLVADSHPDAAESLAALLRCNGYAPRVARTGEEAIRATELDPPDVVLMGLQFPDHDGCEVARRIRSRPYRKRPLLVAITGWEREEDRRRAAEAGIDVYLLKPADPAALLGLLVRFARVVLPPDPDESS